MNVILGFGTTEKGFEKSLEDAIRERVIEEYAAADASYFTDEVRDNVSKWLNALAHESRRESDSYTKAAEYPDRYSYFYETVLHDASHIVFIIKVSHINRRHAMSPDGWGMMQNEMLFYMDNEDIRKARIAA